MFQRYTIFSMFSGCCIAIVMGASLVIGSVIETGILTYSAFTDNYEVFLLDFNRAISHNLTNLPGTDVNPEWSPDGEEIAFVSSADETDIFIVDANGRNRRSLSKMRPEGDRIVWSPDGETIAFLSRISGTFHVYRVDIASTEIEKLQPSFEEAVLPTWSSEQSGLMAQSIYTNRTVQYDIETGEATELDCDCIPIWSPDGKQFAFTQHRDIYVHNTRTGQTINITNTPEWDESPVWSPDGKQIAYVTNVGVRFHIFLASSNGGNIQQLTDSPQMDAFPLWSEDSQHVIFRRTLDRNSEIYAIHVNNGTLRLLESSSRVGTIRWQPTPPTYVTGS